MDDPTKSLSDAMSAIAVNLERLAVAVEKSNNMSEALNKCARCSGDGKDYGGGRCIACAGIGVKPRRGYRRSSDIDDK